MPGTAGGSAAPPVFVSEAAYTEHSVAARWLHRAPTAAEQRARAGAVAALDEAAAPPGEAQPEPSRGAAGGGHSHSALSWEEHAWFLRNSTPDAAARLTPAELQRLQLLSTTVAAEQAAYARERATGGADAEALRFLHPDVAEQVEATLEQRRRRLLAQPSSYVAHGEVRFDAAHVAPQLLHQRLLQTRGCSQMLENPPPGTHIPTSAAALTPAQKAAFESKAGLAPVSADPTCATLAAAEGARVVLASGAFKCLAATLPEQAWALPVTVRGSPDGGAAQKRVFIDGPLLAPRLSLRSKNELYYKHAVLRLAVKDPAAAHEQEHQYRLWRFGQLTLLIRCREHALQQDITPGAPACSTVVRVKLEYAPQLGWEEVTAKEREGWWAALMLRPGANLVVWRVGVADSALLAADRKDLAGVQSDTETPGSRLRPAAALSQLHEALQYVQQLPEGTYLLRRTEGSAAVECLRALQAAQGDGIEGMLDLAASRRDAGATDSENLDFVPIRWQAAHPGVQQIPFTHPPVGQPGLLPRRAARQQQWMLADSGPPPAAEKPARANARPPPAPRRADIRYCHAFAEGRTCKAGERCSFPHLTLAEVEKKASDPYLSQLRDYMKPAKRPRGGAR